MLVSGEEVLAAFDSCSTATLIHCGLIDEGKVEVTKTSSNSNINGIGGIARGKVVEVKLHSRNKEKFIVSNATVVDDNFQQVPVGNIQMLNGQNVGQEFFPREIATFTCGLKVLMHQIKLHNESRYLGFSGRFPAQFTTMYTVNDHPKALVIQEFPQR